MPATAVDNRALEDKVKGFALLKNSKRSATGHLKEGVT